MSLDFSLKDVKPVLVFDMNATHNLVPMWEKAVCYDALYMSDGALAHTVLKDLVKAYVDMKLFRDAYMMLNPENGWGSYDTALDFLRSVINACLDNPFATIGVCK